jgi:hypothetical protein
MGAVFEMAGDLDGIEGISSIDAANLLAAAAYNMIINQATGECQTLS